MKKNKEITPVRAVLIYSIALVLVVFAELPRVLSWMDETRWKLASGEVLEGFPALQTMFRVSDPAGGPSGGQSGPSDKADQDEKQAARPEVADTHPAQDLETPYSMALVVFSELPRVLSWMDETRWKLASGAGLEGFPALQAMFRVSDPAGGPGGAQSGPSDKADQDEKQAARPEVSDIHATQDLEAHVTQSASEDNVLSAEEGPNREDGERIGEDGERIGEDGGREEEKGARMEEPETSSPKLKPRKMLLVGDSMIAEGFGPALQRRLRKCKSLDVVRKGQYSTGFVHQEDFNWASVLRELIRKNKPELIVIHMGTNDPIDILDDSGKRIYFGNDRWRELYSSRVREFLRFVSEKKIMSFWVGLPIMGSNKYCTKINVINSIFERECTKVSGCVYVNSWYALADSKGNYTTFVKGPGGKLTRIRAKDNVHLTEAGGEILSEYFLQTACKYIEFPAGDEGSQAWQ